MPDRLRAIYPRVIAHDDIFAQDADDEMWLRKAGDRGWIVLMKDDRIRYRPAEQRAVIEASVACFCLHPSKDMTGEAMADAFAKALPRILRIVAAEPGGGYIRGVNRHGDVRRLFPRRG